MAAPLALVLVVAVTVRAALFRSSLAEFISERVEVVSPLSSWKRGEAAQEVEDGPGPAAHLPLPARPWPLNEREAGAGVVRKLQIRSPETGPSRVRPTGGAACREGFGAGGPAPRGWGA